MKKTILAIVLMLVPMAAFAQDSAWDYSTKNSLSGKSTEFASVFDNGNNEPSFVVRC